MYPGRARRTAEESGRGVGAGSSSIAVVWVDCPVSDSVVLVCYRDSPQICNAEHVDSTPPVQDCFSRPPTVRIDLPHR